MITFIRNLYLKFKPFMDKINKDNIYANAGQSAFYIILSAVPLTMFIVSMFQNLHISVEYIQSALSFIFSEQIVDYVTSFLTDMYENSVGISFISLIVTLWSAAKGIQAITNGLNRIYDAYENRNWLYLRIRAMIYTVVLFVIIIATLVIIVLGSTINKILAPYFAYLPEIVGLLYSFRFVIIFMYLVVIFALLYRNFPNISRAEHKEYGFRSQLLGAFLCTLSWFVLSFGISIYVNNFNGFSIYGSLTRLAVIMVWLYFCMVCLMLGAEINYFYHDLIKEMSIKKLKTEFKKRKNKK